MDLFAMRMDFTYLGLGPDDEIIEAIEESYLFLS